MKREFCIAATALLTCLPSQLRAVGTIADPTNVAATRPDRDEEPDGLTNQEEAEAGTYPYNAYSDNDDKMDGQDGWALDGILAPPRSPKVSYAVVLLPPTSEMDSPILGDGGHVVLQLNRSFFLWSGGQISTLPIPTANYPGAENPESVTSINSNGDVVGTVMNDGFESYVMDTFVIPFGATAGTVLPRLHQRIIEEGDDTYASYLAPLISNDGRIYNFYSGNNQEGNSVQSGVIWTNGIPAQYGGKLTATGNPYSAIQDGPLIAPKAVNTNGVCAGEYALGLDQALEFQERGCGIWNSSLFKADTNHNRSRLEDITKDNHALGYVNYETSFYAAVWVSKNGTWTPRQIPYYTAKINDDMLGVTGTSLWRNDKFIQKEDLVSKPGLLVNYLYDINNKGVILCNASDNQVNKNALLIPVAVLTPRFNAQGNETGTYKGVDSLKVAQWEKAWKTETTPFGELVDDFIDKDPDRFYVRVPKIGDTQSMALKISTVDAGGATIDDWTEIEMEVDPADTGMMKSKSQLLVADTADKTTSGVSNSSEITPRLHKVALLGKVKFELHIGQAIGEMELPVPGIGKCKTVSLHAVILRDSPGGVPAASEAFVWNDLINNVKSCYAQANINISVESVTVADPPTGVDLSDGLALADTSNVPDEVKMLVDALGTPSADDIGIFYVPSITVPSGGNMGGKGFAIADSFYQLPADRPYVYNAFVGRTQMDVLTTAHELGHLLTDSGHIETYAEHANSNALYLQRNLMFGRWVDPSIPRRIDGSIYDSKRLWNSQVEVIRNNPHAK